MPFGIFKTKSQKQKLEDKYKALLQEAFRLSNVNRRAADQKTAEAEEVMKQIEALQKIDQ